MIYICLNEYHVEIGRTKKLGDARKLMRLKCNTGTIVKSSSVIQYTIVFDGKYFKEEWRK